MKLARKAENEKRKTKEKRIVKGRMPQLGAQQEDAVMKDVPGVTPWYVGSSLLLTLSVLTAYHNSATAN